VVQVVEMLIIVVVCNIMVTALTKTATWMVPARIVWTIPGVLQMMVDSSKDNPVVILPPVNVLPALIMQIVLLMQPTVCGMDLAKIADYELAMVFNNVVGLVLMDLLEPLFRTPIVTPSLVFV